MSRSASRVLLLSLFFGLLVFCFSKPIFAETTPYRSATTITTDGGPAYTNLSNCSVTDGLTCDRASGILFANLYFRDFGDFGIPNDVRITGVRIRVTGKSDIGLFIGVSTGSTYGLNCQTPGDKWTMTSLVGNQISEYNATSISGVDFTSCLNAANVRSNNFIFRINRAGASPWSANIDNFEIAFDYEYINPSSTPSPTPSITPSPTPLSAPEPFLELPWDYEGKGLSFTDAALSINSFFDHEYPLLSAIVEPISTQNSIIVYKGGARNLDEDYSSHDGYDYGSPAKVEYGDIVTAASAGIAKYINSCDACGNAIHIDHGNGYQTRYYHLQLEGLISSIPNQEIPVDAGKVVGRVGATGNVRPKGEDGAHIHFMVVQDKNNNGNFDDNIPDGVVDPFGWQSKSPDPWENYSFFYNGEDRAGNKSYYLWKEKIDGLDTTLDSNGGFFLSGRNSINFPQGATDENLILKIISSPLQKISDLLRSIGPTVEVTAEDALGNEVTNFNEPFSLTMDFSDLDLSKIATETLSIYSTSDGIDWVKEDTVVDLENKKATIEADHLTQFALVAERKDIVPATTSAVISGTKGEEGYYRSNVSVSLVASDNINGLGVNYILYRKDEGEWDKYISPVEFSTPGLHKLEFYSVDNDENIEDSKTISFYIDEAPPEVEIEYSLGVRDMIFVGKDGSESANVSVSNAGNNKKVVVKDKAGNTLSLIVNKYNNLLLSYINILSLQYNLNPVIVQSKNTFIATPVRNVKTGQFISISELFSMKDKNLIGVFYNSKTSKTLIYNYDSRNRQFVKEDLPGIRLLKLKTESATLKYSY